MREQRIQQFLESAIKYHPYDLNIEAIVGKNMRSNIYRDKDFENWRNEIQDLTNQRMTQNVHSSAFIKHTGKTHQYIGQKKKQKLFGKYASLVKIWKNKL